MSLSLPSSLKDISSQTIQQVLTSLQTEAGQGLSSTEASKNYYSQKINYFLATKLFNNP
jgi:hypothetical protein